MAEELEPSDSLDALFRRAAGGERDALNRVSVECRRRIAHIVRKAKPRRGGLDDADDIIQEALCRSFEQVQRGSFHYQSPAALQRWLERIVLSVITDRHAYHTAERRDRDNERSLDEETIQSARMQTADSVIERVTARECAALLAAAIDRIEDPSKREFSRLAFIERWSVAAIARHMDIPIRDARKEYHARSAELHYLLGRPFGPNLDAARKRKPHRGD